MNQIQCKHAKGCGGCQYVELDYEKELERKVAKVQGLFRKWNKKIDEVISNEEPHYYRNKVHLSFKLSKTKNVVSGIYEEHTRNIITVDKCLLHAEKIDEVSEKLNKILTKNKILPATEKGGVLKHALIRYGFSSKEVMVVLVTTTPLLPGRNNIVKELIKEAPEVTTIVQNINSRNTPIVLGEQERVLYGPGFIYDSLCGMKFKISPKSFFQINPKQTEKLYRKALNLAQLKKSDMVIDAYSGIGTIGLLAAKDCRQVISVESNQNAVKDAKINAKLNQIDNVIFHCEDATKFLQDIKIQKDKIDCLFMDPPRTGSTKQFLEAILELNIPKVVYISCNPETLVTDLEILREKYQIKNLTVVDMFSRTEHVENIVLLSLKTA